LFCYLMPPRPPRAPLFPYTTLFRSGEMEDAVALADPSTAVEHDVRADPGALAQFDPGTDDRVRPDRDLCRQLRTVMDDGSGVNRSEEHTLNSSHQIISYAVFCLKKK